MKDWYDNLEAREQVFVLIGAIFVGIALIYYMLWAPLDRNHRQVETRVDTWERSLAELRPLRAMVASGGLNSSSGAIPSQQAPIIVVSQTLQSRGLEQYRRRSQPTTSNGIRVEFEEVAFDDLMLWLGDLSDNYAMYVQSGSLSEGDAIGDGRINASLTLERSL
jgi:general secretion pathway protein M